MTPRESNAPAIGDEDTVTAEPRTAPISWRALGAVALWFGLFGFGGGYAVAQRVRYVVVEEKKWMPEEAFLEHFAVAGALPGTAATNLLTMLGLRFTGVSGAVVCAVGFLLPSVLMMIAFAVAYDRVRGFATVATFLDGMGFATVGVVAAVAIDMRRVAMKTRVGFMIACFAVVALTLRVFNLLEVVTLAGLVGMFMLRPTGATVPPISSRLSSVGALPMLLAASGSLAPFVVFARLGIATFGVGIAMIPSIEHEVVSVRGWLSEAAFHDAMVLGQVTPGPVAIAATFIGYRVDGLAGSMAATLGMFGPPFVLSLLAARSLTAFRTNPHVRGFLLGVSPAVVGVIAAAAVGVIAAAAVALFRTSISSVFSAVIALMTLALLARFPKVSPIIPLAIGGALNDAGQQW